MKPVRFHPDAEAEMVDAARWYEIQQENLGKRFLATVQDAANRINFNPLLFSCIENDVRRCLAKSFPFAILFRTRSNQITIVAVMHQRRDPDYWKDRMVEED